MSRSSHNVCAMLRPRTGAVVCLAVAAVVTVAVRETPAGVTPSPSALPPSALIVALNGNDANPGSLVQPLATIQNRAGSASAASRGFVNAHIPGQRSEEETP